MKAHMLEHPQNFKGDPVATWRGLEEPFKIRLYVGWSYSFPGVKAELTWQSAKH